MKYVARLLTILSVTVLFILCSSPSSTEAQNRARAKNRVWTASEILAERTLKAKEKKNPPYCNGGAFKPCVCARSVTKLVQYRPAVKECDGRAAIILSGKYLNAYSAVVRDFENKDRWPVQGVNGCTPFERDTLGLNKCSVFKVQEVLGIEDDVADAEVHCLGASGYGPLFSRVRRITIKLADIPNSNADPLVRLCLFGPTKPLN